MIGSITDTDLFGRALITEDAATVAAVMLPHCQGKCLVAAVALLHLRVILPLPPRLACQLHLRRRT